MTFPVLAGRTAQTPPNAILRVSTITTGRPPSLAHLHGQMCIPCLQIRTTGGTCLSFPTTPLHLFLPLYLSPSLPAALGPAEPYL